MTYVIGIDCGGTKTEAVAYDEKGHQLATKVTGFGNLLVDYPTALANIQAAVQAVLDELGAGCQQLVFGIAGIDSGGLKERLEAEVSHWKLPITLMNDGQLAHYAILQGADGIVVIAGTGSVILGRHSQEWYRVGGWGHLLGDGGGAFDIARKAIKQSLFEFDLGESPSELSRALFKHFKVDDVFGITKAVYSMEKGAIAEVASLVADLAEENEIAKAILQSAGTELATSVAQLAHKMPATADNLKIGLNGSVIEKNPIVREAFFNGLVEQLPEENVEVLDKIASSALGAYYYNKRNGIK
ncbi:hypothetical protein I6N95_16565 [Vagococcus sp. BWB3-3]|uniref:ATPase BadF/BadG/BcrA/BcrD type domain-containing protein n=1 Tax=Vagococcus allomyrinae TaxID=2794353 RepID=A0A940PAJ2_9ENTE|nr:BadF/BadG/BcrA/BcrD ATPase family protein [Vagococcus allomyrinae]MBP1042631.1 hypothetical protein [Vagococcus allomyrinae]